MPSTTAEPLAAQLASRAGELLTGDTGLVVLRALLENGVGYVVGAWQERPTPIDAAIEAARASVLARRGILTRRLGSIEALEALVAAPQPLADAPPEVSAIPRGLVVFGGRHGMTPVLARFADMVVPGGVVGLCFDASIVGREDAIVIDPVATAHGLMEAIDAGYAASVRAGRPAIIVVRERTLGMRGTIRCREERAPLVAAVQDAASPRSASTIDALEHVGMSELLDAPSGRMRRVIVIPARLQRVVERALAALSGESAAVERALDDVGIVLAADGGTPPRIEQRHVDDALLLGVPSGATERCGAWVRARLGVDAAVAPLDPERLTALDVVRAVAAWLDVPLPDAPGTDELTARTLAQRVPRRGEKLHRSIGPCVAAGLELAQGVIGVPQRADSAHPTYLADTGVPLTIVTASDLVEHGSAVVAPGAPAGVIIACASTDAAAASVVGAASEMASRGGMSVEVVDGGSPRAIARAVAMAARAPRATTHVIIPTYVARAAASSPTDSTFGVDPDLLGTDRIAVAAMPTDATAIVEFTDGLFGGPLRLPRRGPSVEAHAPQLRELSAASWQLRLVRRRGAGRMSDAAWSLRRRIIRAAGGVDL